MFDRNNPELSLSEVEERSGLPKVTAFRFLAAVAQHGLIYKNPESGQYSLGNALISLAEIAKARPGVGSQALPVMRRIGQTLHENVALNLREGDFQRRVQTVEAAEGAVRTMLPLGLLAPLYVATAGRAMLARWIGDAAQRPLSTKQLPICQPSNKQLALAAGAEHPLLEVER